MPASQHTSVGLTPYSVSTFTSIEAKPKIALVGNPREVAIVSGSAKKARYARLLPSIRKSSRRSSDIEFPSYGWSRRSTCHGTVAKSSHAGAEKRVVPGQPEDVGHRMHEIR